MATITGDIITDAVVNLKAALDTKIATWGVSDVFRYQAQEVGKRGDCIAIEVVGWQPVLVQSAGSVQEIDHKVTMRVWYIHGTGLRADAAFDDVYSMLSKIVIYLIENPRPNGYGELLLSDQAFGPTVESVGEVKVEQGGFLAGKFTLVHTLVQKQHTLTLT